MEMLYLHHPVQHLHVPLSSGNVASVSEELNFQFDFNSLSSECIYIYCAESLQSCLTLSDPMDYSLPGSSVRGFSRREYWSGLLCLPPGGLSDPGVEPASLLFPALAGRFFTTSAAWDAHTSACCF